MSTVPVAEGLFTWPTDDPQLIGGTCRVCGTTTFPKQDSCPCCTAPEVDERLLDRRGTLWTFTIQGFRPKEPYLGPPEFTPYGVGYIELPGQVMVETLLTINDVEQLAIGAPMQLTIVPAFIDADGNDRVTFAFRPTSASTSSAGDRRAG
jgi:uncharacterized OB-fold protein